MEEKSGYFATFKHLKNMPEKPSFTNWSLKKLLSTIPDNLEQSRVKILYTFLIFSILKVLVVVPMAYQNDQSNLLKISMIILLVYIALTKLLLSHKKYAILISHLMIIMGFLIVTSILFFFSKTINIMALQFTFMIILSGFYLLNRQFGVFYSILAVVPVVLFMIQNGSLDNMNSNSRALGSPAYEIMVFLNFVTMILAHYLFYQALRRSVNEKELLNEKLQIAVMEANIAAQSKSDFLSTMSHELRTPLNSVIGMAELLNDELTSVEQQENLKILNFSAASLHTLINDILDYNKLGSEKLYLEAIGVNLYSLLNDICSGLRIQAKDKGLDLILDIDEDIRQFPVSTDPTRITQIIFNLVGNAIKFTSKGSITIQLKILNKDSEHLEVRFSVKDTGIGIGADQAELIFEPFTQASTSTTRNYGGTGLGLAIVKRLLTLFGSSIKLESKEGQGSKFWFDINFRRNDQLPESVINDEEPIQDLNGLKVLVVEDNPVNSLLLKKIFYKWNNTPDFAKDGYQALEKINENTYDLVLMDIHMPILDGYETTEKIRKLENEEKSRIYIIALTASVSNHLYDKIIAAGMNDYLSKPYNPRELYAKLKEILINKK